jgi:hypothetical protein
VYFVCALTTHIVFPSQLLLQQNIEAAHTLSCVSGQNVKKCKISLSESHALYSEVKNKYTQICAHMGGAWEII